MEGRDEVIYKLTYTTDVPGGRAGGSKLWMIYIRPEAEGDVGLFQHEYWHVIIFWICSLIVAALVTVSSYVLDNTFLLGLLPLCFAIDSALYLWCGPFREWCEVLCYRRQLNYQPASEGDRMAYISLYAEFISTKYGMKVTKEEAVKMLQ